ncbi:TetR/AcrR family transcriptional regulator [Paeniglutamicibacter sp. NPDC091659]|uniref:TetR/AcrR family transcriptional regulator n=1 Tax=Paeniglutamicibacter sp. NPDC091659 TaxID=3364389 RepID=UPI00382F25C6
MSNEERPVRSGRPRSVPNSNLKQSPREQILDAAAELFVENGFKATTTRAIAERVGIRQASLYYHFNDKEEILAELLGASIRPTAEAVRRVEALVDSSESAASALYALVRFDVETLIKTTHNIAILWLLPEMQNERYDNFRFERQELLQAYGRLGAAAASNEVSTTVSEEQLGAIMVHMTELIAQLRRAGELDASFADVIAATCLRVCGLDAASIELAVADSKRLLV